MLVFHLSHTENTEENKTHSQNEQTFNQNSQLKKNGEAFLFGGNHFLVSRKGIAWNVDEGLEAMWFMHRDLRQYFPVKLDILLCQAMNKVAIFNLL